MKKLFFASLWALACLAAACSDEKDEPNDESGSIVGEWVFQRNEYYRNGKLVDSFTAVEEEDKAIAIFREDGTYRYYDFPPEEYYDGTYSYDEMSGVLTTDDGVNEQTCLTEITVCSRDGNTVPIFLRISIFCVRNSRCRFRESPENGVSFFGQMFTYIPDFRK